MRIKNAPIIVKTALIGSQLGDYTLTRLLATGGMSRIYEGVDKRLERRAAIKVLDLEAEPEEADDMKIRFQREARALAKLEHPHIISIYQYGDVGNYYFIAMKLVEGNDLAQELKELKRVGTHMEPARAIRILEQVASALDAAHAVQIIHRDVKPSNILIDLTDKAILSDFGLVISPAIDSTFGTAFGTPRYISPEQATDSSMAVPQSDIYSLGVIVYEVLTGRTPFDGKSAMEIAISHINEPPPPPRSVNALIPLEVERALLKALAKDPDRRFRTAGEFLAAVRKGYRDAGVLPDDTANLQRTTVLPNLTSQLPPPTTRRLPIVPMLAALAVVIVIGAGIALLGGTNRAPEATNAATVPSVAAVIDTQALATVAPVGEATLTAISSTAQPVLVPISPEELQVVSGALVIDYNDAALTLINTGAETLPLANLRLVAGTVLFTGDQIRGGTLAAGECYRLRSQDRADTLPAGCTSLKSEIAYSDSTRLFWRADITGLPSFLVALGGTVLVVCDNVARGAALTCRVPVEES